MYMYLGKHTRKRIKAVRVFVCVRVGGMVTLQSMGNHTRSHLAPRHCLAAQPKEGETRCKTMPRFKAIEFQLFRMKLCVRERLCHTSANEKPSKQTVQPTVVIYLAVWL